MVQKKEFNECEHPNLVTRKNNSFYCRECGYDSQRAQPSGKLANVMKQLWKAREGNRDLAKSFQEVTGELQNRIGKLREEITKKDKEIAELKSSIEVMLLDEET